MKEVSGFEKGWEKTYADVKGQRWSYCDSKWARIQYKKTLGDCAVDGNIPKGQLRSPEQAKKDAMEWLERLESEGVQEVYRPSLDIILTAQEVESRLKKYGDFSKMNRMMNQSRSKTTAEKFKENPELFEHYHRLYREARGSWELIPFDYYIELFKERPHAVIGDFGCGEAKLAQNLSNTVYSFDHVPLNDHVQVSDISNVPLEEGCLDAVVFSLSLMGSNFKDYLKEAFRTLRLDGILFIAEATSRFNNLDVFCDRLESMGFGVERPRQREQFSFITARKNKSVFNDSVEISFRD